MRKRNCQVAFAGGADDLVWKSPVAGFGVNTPLAVPFSHEAILVKDGQPLETYAPGRYVLNEDTTPIFGSLSDQEVGHCEVYYVNKSMCLRLPWGTPAQMDLFDPKLNLPVRVGASGEFEVRVENSRKLLFKLAGSRERYCAEDFSEFFRARVALLLKDAVAKAVVEEGISYYEISAHLAELSLRVYEKLAPEFTGYGIRLTQFTIGNVSIPQETKRALEQAYLAAARGGAGKERFCPACGAKADDSANFCSRCGGRL